MVLKVSKTTCSSVRAPASKTKMESDRGRSLKPISGSTWTGEHKHAQVHVHSVHTCISISSITLPLLHSDATSLHVRAEKGSREGEKRENTTS